MKGHRLKSPVLIALLIVVSALCSCSSVGKSGDGAVAGGAGRFTGDATVPAIIDASSDAPTSAETYAADNTGTADVSASEGVNPDTDTPTERTLPEPGEIKPAVYMYHLIMEEPYSVYDGLFVRPDDFRAHLDAINAAGAKYLFADEYMTADEPSVVLTFDDGYEDNYTTMFPILKEKGALATVFLITDYIGTPGYMTEAQIREMADSGFVRFGCHTKSHVDLASLGEDAIRAQIFDAADEIERIVGRKVKSLAYPAGSYSDTVIRIAGERIEFAYTTKSPSNDSQDDPLAIPRYRVNRGVGASLITGTLG